MSVAFAEPVLDRPVTEVTVDRAAPAPVRTRPRRTGPGVGPAARPRRVRFVAPPARDAKACRPAPAVAPRVPESRASWRLTERGLVVVLALAAALVAASVVVVGLTALRVTSESYSPSHSVAAPVAVDR